MSSRFQEANWKVELVESVPDPDVMLDLDAGAAASAGPALMLGPAPPRKMTGKNPISTLPRVTCVAHGNARMNAMAVRAFDVSFEIRVPTCRKSGRRLLAFSSGADEDNRLDAQEDDDTNEDANGDASTNSGSAMFWPDFLESGKTSSKWRSAGAWMAEIMCCR